jgi:hypothetical protein
MKDDFFWMNEKNSPFIVLYNGSLISSSMFFGSTAKYFGACLHVKKNICEASSHVVEKFLQL